VTRDPFRDPRGAYSEAKRPPVSGSLLSDFVRSGQLLDGADSVSVCDHGKLPALRTWRAFALGFEEEESRNIK